MHLHKVVKSNPIVEVRSVLFMLFMEMKNIYYWYSGLIMVSIMDKILDLERNN